VKHFVQLYSIMFLMMCCHCVRISEIWLLSRMK